MITADGANTVAELVLLVTLVGEILFVSPELTLTVGFDASVSLLLKLLEDIIDSVLVEDNASVFN